MSDSRSKNSTSSKQPHNNAAQSSADQYSDMSEAGRRLGHELANLLDGSMRCLGLAMRSLDEDPTADQKSSTDKADDVLKKLQTADGALKEMSRLVHEWMKTPASQQKSLSWLSPTPPQGLTNSSSPLMHSQGSIETLGYAIRLVTDMHLVECESIGCRLIIEMDDDTDVLPAGPLLGVIENLIKNAIEAIREHPDQSPHQIKLVGNVSQDILSITVDDTGRGVAQTIEPGKTTKPKGHGIGLDLCKDIIQALNGTMSITNNPKGLCVKLTVPVDMLVDGLER